MPGGVVVVVVLVRGTRDGMQVETLTNYTPQKKPTSRRCLHSPTSADSSAGCPVCLLPAAGSHVVGRVGGNGAAERPGGRARGCLRYLVVAKTAP